MFRQLSRDEVKEIAEIMLKEVFGRMGEKGITLTVSDAFKERLVEEGYNPAYGARPLRRAVMRLLEDYYTPLPEADEERMFKGVNASGERQ